MAEVDWKDLYQSWDEMVSECMTGSLDTFGRKIVVLNSVANLATMAVRYVLDMNRKGFGLRDSFYDTICSIERILPSWECVKTLSGYARHIDDWRCTNIRVITLGGAMERLTLNVASEIIEATHSLMEEYDSYIRDAGWKDIDNNVSRLLSIAEGN